MKMVVVDKSELEKGEHEEETEHGFSEPVAKQTAIDHLTKKDPQYYTKADAAGLEEYNYKGESDRHQGIPNGINFPFTQKSGRMWKIRVAAKKGPIMAGGR